MIRAQLLRLLRDSSLVMQFKLEVHLGDQIALDSNFREDLQDVRSFYGLPLALQPFERQSHLRHGPLNTLNIDCHDWRVHFEDRDSGDCLRCSIEGNSAIAHPVVPQLLCRGPLRRIHSQVRAADIATEKNCSNEIVTSPQIELADQLRLTKRFFTLRTANINRAQDCSDGTDRLNPTRHETRIVGARARGRCSEHRNDQHRRDAAEQSSHEPPTLHLRPLKSSRGILA